MDTKQMISTPKQQRKKPSASMPAPFLSFQVENENCAVYVGNIPSDERSPCPVCSRANDDTAQEQNCACASEIKAFLRDRINAAFKVPIEGIGIRTCRLFSVVTNVYSNTLEGDDEQRSDRRVHRAACVEFDEPKIAEHCLALKFTSFHFNGQSHNRSSLRMRRWTSQPPKPPPLPEKSKSLSPSLAWSPKQPMPSAAPRSKSTSPRITSKQRQQQLPPPPPPRTVSPNAGHRKQRRKQLFANSTINERPSSPVVQALTPLATNLVGTEELDGRASPSPSSCLVHVGNIPFEATYEELCKFFLERMNKAFHGVTPPEIVRLGMRYSEGERCDACVEFQEPKVAHRATLLRNRRWYARDEDIPQNEEEEDLNANSNHSLNSNSNHSDERKRRNAMPVLEIELWDPSKYDTSDFFSTTSAVRPNNNTVLGSTFYQENDFADDDYGLWEIGAEPLKKDSGRQSPKATPKSSPTQSKKTMEEARECGFLICTNPNKIPKCDHLFTIFPQPGEDMGEVKKAKLCHGYAFRGKLCRNIHKKRSGSGKKLCGPMCPFAHLDSFDQLKDPHDILSLLYYVENNDEVEFSSGTGCTPQEYLLRQRERQPKPESIPTRKNIRPILSQPTHSQIDSSTQSTEDILRELRSSLSAVRQELLATQEQLQKSELARQSLLEQRYSNKDEKDTAIFALQKDVAQLRIELQEANHKVKTSALAAENDSRKYAFLQEKYKLHVSREGKSAISTELLESEIIKLREELKKSQSDYKELQQQQKPSENPGSDDYFLNSFLEGSTTTLMQFMDTNADDQPKLDLSPQPHARKLDLSPQRRVRKLDLSPQPRLAEIPIDCDSSPFVPYKAKIDSKSIQLPGLSATATPPPPILEDELDSLRSEIEYVVSCYGNQVFVNANATDGSTAVTRFLKLPMNLYKGRDIDVALVVSLPKEYPWKGIVEVHSDSRYTNHLGADSQYRKLASESISGLLNVCRWEAEACQGKPHVLMNIMKAAERWVMNDWKIIQKKKWDDLDSS